jgi:hypothetical protein
LARKILLPAFLDKASGAGNILSRQNAQEFAPLFIADRHSDPLSSARKWPSFKLVR